MEKCEINCKFVVRRRFAPSNTNNENKLEFFMLEDFVAQERQRTRQHSAVENSNISIRQSFTSLTTANGMRMLPVGFLSPNKNINSDISVLWFHSEWHEMPEKPYNEATYVRLVEDRVRFQFRIGIIIYIYSIAVALHVCCNQRALVNIIVSLKSSWKMTLPKKLFICINNRPTNTDIHSIQIEENNCTKPT